jgi:hypothetical protein
VTGRRPIKRATVRKFARMTTLPPTTTAIRSSFGRMR